MRNIEGLTVNWIDTSIVRLLKADGGVLSRYAFVMISSVDSSNDMEGFASGYQFLSDMGCSDFEKNLLVPGNQIAAVATQLFNGFDEIWCFDERPTKPKPSDLWIVPPLDLSRDDVPELLILWMKESNCRLGLGDGIGMNYASLDRETAQRLEESRRS
jgi:hypothetical protein